MYFEVTFIHHIQDQVGQVIYPHSRPGWTGFWATWSS